MKEYEDKSGLDKLAILWKSADREAAMHFALMYPRVSRKNGWWDIIRLIVWGPSIKLLAADEELQLYIHNMLDNDIEVVACKGSADMYGVGEKLCSLGVEVTYMGEHLTKMLKANWKIITI